MKFENNKVDTEKDTAEAQQGCNEEDDDVVSSTVREIDLIPVKMPFRLWDSKLNGKKGPKKRQSHALKQSFSRIETLEDQNETLRTKLKSAQKRIQLFESAKQNFTPKSKTDALLKRAGLRPRDVPVIGKQLLYAECVNEEVRNAMSQSPKEMACLQEVVSGKVMKYRMRSYLEKMTLLERRQVVKNNTE